MGLEHTALPISWGRIGPECLNLTVPRQRLEKTLNYNQPCFRATDSSLLGPRISGGEFRTHNGRDGKGVYRLPGR